MATPDDIVRFGDVFLHAAVLLLAWIALLGIVRVAICASDRLIYWYGRRTGQIPACTPGHCYCPSLCECFTLPEDTQ